MIVKELIKQLLEFDQELAVRVPYDSFAEGLTQDVYSASIEIKREKDCDDDNLEEIGKQFVAIW